MKEKALNYLKNNVSVIPLKPNEKLPLVRWEEFTKRLPTIEEIEMWWTQWPDANIGLITGEISGITVVDFDNKGGSLSPKLQQFPKTKAVVTPSGGYHLYYKYQKGIPTVSDIFKDNSGIDIRNDGGYVVVPPSTVNGLQYYVHFLTEPIEFPSALFPGVSHSSEKKEMTQLVGIQTGSRNDSLTKVIGKLLKTTKEEKWNDEIWPVVLQINQTYSPPLEIDEVKMTYTSICRKEKQSQLRSSNEDLNEFLNGQDIPEMLKNIQDEKTKSSVLQGLAAYSGEDEMVGTDEIVKQIEKEGVLEKFYTGWSGIDSILGGFTPGQVIVLSAPTKNGKTSLCMDMTLKMKQYSPAWFPFEEGAQELVSKYLERKQTPPQFFTPKAMTDHTVDWIERKIVESLVKYNSRIFFIDHLHFIVPPTSNNMSQQIGLTMRKLKGIAKTWNVVIVLIAHLKKTKLDQPPDLEDLRDSSFIGQEADTVIMLWRDTKRENKQVIITDKVILSVQANRRTGKTGNIALMFDDGRFLEDGWEESSPNAPVQSTEPTGEEMPF